MGSAWFLSLLFLFQWSTKANLPLFPPMTEAIAFRKPHPVIPMSRPKTAHSSHANSKK
jgi:hypothetical protein